MTRGTRRSLISHAHSDLSLWPAPDTNIMEEATRAEFVRRRESVVMYAAGEPFSVIADQTGKHENEVRRLVRRCVTSNGYGGIFGFTALVKGTRVNQYTRTKNVSRVIGSGSGGCSGALQKLFQSIPDVARYIENLFFKLGNGDIIHEARIPYYALHSEFKKLLREYGVSDNDWPFNTANCGYKSLVLYCKKLRDENLARWIKVRSGNDASRRSCVGQGFRTLIPVNRPFSHVQLDFHKVDAASVIILQTEFGNELKVPLSRWHIGVLADERSHAVLGVFIVLEINPSSDSVLEIVESAIRPDKLPEVDAPIAISVDGKVLPNTLIPGLEYQGFAALKMDNAWSNIATEVVNNIIDVTGAAVNFGPVRAWWRRPLVERIFKELTNRGLQRLPSTYGCGSTDTRKNDPNQKAIEFNIKLSDLKKLIHACIKENNEKADEGLNFSTPLNVLRASIENNGSNFLPQPIPYPVRNDLRLLQHVVECVVRGDLTKNIRPYVKIDRCRYTNERLANSYFLLQKTVVVYLDRRDSRIAHCTVKETGELLGPLIVERRWASHAISIRDRKLINRSGLSQRTMDDRNDPVLNFSKEKKQELYVQRKNKSQQKRCSKIALTLARLPESAQNTQPTNNLFSTLKAEPSSKSDPFGLNTVPVVSSLKGTLRNG